MTIDYCNKLAASNTHVGALYKALTPISCSSPIMQATGFMDTYYSCCFLNQAPAAAGSPPSTIPVIPRYKYTASTPVVYDTQHFTPDFVSYYGNVKNTDCQAFPSTTVSVNDPIWIDQHQLILSESDTTPNDPSNCGDLNPNCMSCCPGFYPRGVKINTPTSSSEPFLYDYQCALTEPCSDYKLFANGTNLNDCYRVGPVSIPNNSGTGSGCVSGGINCTVTKNTDACPLPLNNWQLGTYAAGGFCEAYAEDGLMIPYQYYSSDETGTGFTQCVIPAGCKNTVNFDTDGAQGVKSYPTIP
jgi:hypothetical protein